MLAEKYYRISVEMPFILDMKPVPEPKCWSNEVINRLMLVFSVLASAIAGVGSQTTIISASFNYFIMGFLNMVVTLITTCVLIRAVNKIRHCLEENKEKVNTIKIWLHSISFGLYTVSIVVSTMGSGFDLETSWLKSVVGFFAFFSAHVSLAILVFILWELGNPIEEERAETEPAQEEESEEDYEEQEAIQARIWNQFIQKKRQEEYTASVTVAMIRENRSMFVMKREQGNEMLDNEGKRTHSNSLLINN
jgi:large-conductance mechanosensitive channel